MTLLLQVIAVHDVPDQLVYCQCTDRLSRIWSAQGRAVPELPCRMFTLRAREFLLAVTYLVFSQPLQRKRFVNTVAYDFG